MTMSVTCDLKCVKMRKYRPTEELGSSPSLPLSLRCFIVSLDSFHGQCGPLRLTGLDCGGRDRDSEMVMVASALYVDL